MGITVINNTTPAQQKSNRYKQNITAGASWFVLDMGLGTAADIYHCTKANNKIVKKDIFRQAGKNALWAGIFSIGLSPFLVKMYNKASENKLIDKEDSMSTLGFATMSILMAFRLFVSSRPHPKWKGAFSKFADFFL